MEMVLFELRNWLLIDMVLIDSLMNLCRGLNLVLLSFYFLDIMNLLKAMNKRSTLLFVCRESMDGGNR